jgi:O-antigen/teichoic acid export membrane protein
MGFVQKDAFRTMSISYFGLLLGYLNKGVLFILILSTEQIGLINLLLSVGLLFAQFSNLGTIYAITKFFPFFKGRNKDNKGFLKLILITVGIGICICIFFTFIFQERIADYYSIKSKEFVEYYFWIIPIGIANVLFLIFENYLRSLYKNLLAVFSYELLLRILLSGLLGLYFLKVIDFHFFVIAHALLYLIPTVILALYLIYLKELDFRFTKIKIPSKIRKIVISYSALSYVNSLGNLLVTTLDALMIAYFLGLRATGIYTTIIYLTSALQVPYKSLIRVSSPLIPLYWKQKNWDLMKELYQKVSSVSLVLALFMFSLVWINRGEIFSLLPSEYLEGIWVFLFLMIGKILDQFFSLNGVIFSVSDKYKYDIIFTIVLLILVFSLNYVFIPKFGIAGAALSTGIAYIAYNVGRLIFIWKVYNLHPFQKNQFKIIVSFALIVIFFEIKPWKFDFIYELIFNSSLFSLLFFIPIYVFNWETEIKAYWLKAKKFILSKI